MPLHIDAAMFATGFVDNAPRDMVPNVNEPLLQLVNAVFLFCVMSGSVETSRYHVLNFIATDLQLFKIFKITRLSFFGTQCSCNIL